MFNTRFNLPVYDGTFNELPSLTKQAFKDDCDINVLYARFVKANPGVDPLDGPTYVVDMEHLTDVSAIRGLQGMFEKADEATEIFYNLPPDVRFKFGNDPANLRQAIESYQRPEDLAKYGIYLKGVNDSATQIKSKEKSPDVPPDGSQGA